MDNSARAKRGQFIAAAIQELEPRGFNITGPLVQADVETGRFRKIIGLNNFWGIKASSSWTGKTVETLTTELFYDMGSLAHFVDRKTNRIESCTFDPKKGRVSIKVLEDFRDWYIEREAMRWYSGLLSRLYPRAWMHRGDSDPTKFFEGLVSGKFKWATDQAYAKILVDRWERYYKGREL